MLPLPELKQSVAALKGGAIQVELAETTARQLEFVVRHLVGLGYSTRGIARYLMRHRYPNSRGVVRWSSPSVLKLLRRLGLKTQRAKDE